MLRNVLPLACFLLAGLSSSVTGQNFRVLVAAFTDTVPASYFKDRGMNGVIASIDENGIHRYFFGSYPTRIDAEKVRQQLIKKGFEYASIVDLEEQRVLSDLKSCAYFPGGPEFDASPDSVRVIRFDLGKAILSAEAKTELDWAFQQLKSNPKLELRILGYTDAVGAGKANIDLAAERARAARNYLADKGIKPNQMLLRVFGESAAVPAEGEIDEEFKSELEYLRQYFRCVILALVQGK